MLAPLIWYLFSFRKFTDCTKLGYFVLVMPLMGLALLICYIWGRYYAAKLDYARTVRNFLDDTDTVTDTISYEESKESKRFSPKSKNSLPYMSSSTESASPNVGNSKTDSYKFDPLISNKSSWYHHRSVSFNRKKARRNNRGSCLGQKAPSLFNEPIKRIRSYCGEIMLNVSQWWRY